MQTSYSITSHNVALYNQVCRRHMLPACHDPGSKYQKTFEHINILLFCHNSIQTNWITIYFY